MSDKLISVLAGQIATEQGQRQQQHDKACKGWEKGRRWPT
ncbi:MAG: hypothetical protein OFPI_27660 [Osedax symbiont Rs2]|nr:MAG: hypothetical protein OFPI_27660 [Osedax symbiont Rs2]